MIIFRYLAKEVLASMFAVSLVLLLIIISARFVSYLAEAAAGGIDAGVLLTLMAFRLPAYLELILPLGLFIGIMMAYGRLHMDSEMTVLSACGVSENRLLTYTLITSFAVALLVAIFSLVLGPEGVRASETLLAEQRSRTDFETLKPARFHELDAGRGVSYAGSISDDKQRLGQVFIAQLAKEGGDDVPTILMAESGETLVDVEKGRKYLLLKNGRRYVGRPGDGNYEVVAFEQYAQRLPDQDFNVKAKKASDAMTTAALWRSDNAQAKAALHWRLSLPVLVMVIAIMAVPLSRTQPRKGRYGKLVPAILLYMIYLVAVNAARGMTEKANEPTVVVLWLVHAAFLALGLLMFFWPRLRLSLKSPKHREAQV
ncbi:LPS export ABC transporter permease LptF [Agaribacterium sp. ZY112]|uniref:LPS export ABC transporter permease LptF n=1 Tax=Agaribacterium sp. ZY112 TaxID=3233574 RepID=UPI003525DC66